MTTYTLPVSDALATLLAKAPDERRRVAEQAAVEALAEVLEPDALTDADLASLSRGFADADAGRVFDGPTCMADLRAELGLPARA